jgi:methylated-DNA-protein-cysteine methyltransferase-like protein
MRRGFSYQSNSAGLFKKLNGYPRRASASKKNVFLARRPLGPRQGNLPFMKKSFSFRLPASRRMSPRWPSRSIYEKIYEVVRQVPPGNVATYGQIAKIVGFCTPRMVGYAMAALPQGVDVPWQRVINHKGEISTRSRGDGAWRQRGLLRTEGIRFDRKGRINLKKVRWPGPSQPDPQR